MTQQTRNFNRLPESIKKEWNRYFRVENLKNQHEKFAGWTQPQIWNGSK